MSQEKTTVYVINEASAPISNLIVAHWQEIGSDKSEWENSLTLNCYNYTDSENENKPLSVFSFEIDDEKGHNNYWIVLWMDFQGKTIQFLKDESSSFIKELERDVMKEVDDLMGDLVDTLTESDFGSIASSILNKAIDKVRQNDGVGIVEDKINSDNPVMNITIHCNAYHQNKKKSYDVEFESGRHTAPCNVYSYYKSGTFCNP